MVPQREIKEQIKWDYAFEGLVDVKNKIRFNSSQSHCKNDLKIYIAEKAIDGTWMKYLKSAQGSQDGREIMNLLKWVMRQ